MSGRSFLNGPEFLALEDGTALYLLPALEVLAAKREAQALAEELDGDAALCANACILAKAWRRKGKAICADGRDVLARLGVSQIQLLAKRWAEFDRAENPGLSESAERIDGLKKAWSTCPGSAFNGMCSAIFGRSRRKRA